MPQAGKEDRSRLIPLDSIEMRANCETERRTDLFPLAANNFSNIEGRYAARPAPPSLRLAKVPLAMQLDRAEANLPCLTKKNICFAWE
jgi:hypothetical protein